MLSMKIPLSKRQIGMTKLRSFSSSFFFSQTLLEPNSFGLWDSTRLTYEVVVVMKQKWRTSRTALSLTVPLLSLAALTLALIPQVQAQTWCKDHASILSCSSVSVSVISHAQSLSLTPSLFTVCLASSLSLDFLPSKCERLICIKLRSLRKATQADVMTVA